MSADIHRVFERVLREIGYDIESMTRPANRRIFIVREIDGTVTEVPCTDILFHDGLPSGVAKLVEIFRKTRGTTCEEREASRGLA